MRISSPQWLVAYSTSKAAVISLTQTSPKQLAPYNVNVKAIYPGFIWPPLWESASATIGESLSSFKNKGLSAKEVFDEMVQDAVALKRPQTVEDIGSFVVFFASNEAREITDQALNVCDGSAFN